MTVPKMAKKTGGMAPKRKMKGGNDGELSLNNVTYKVEDKGEEGICVKVVTPAAAPAPAEGEEQGEGVADPNAKPTTEVTDAQENDSSKIKSGVVDEGEQSFGGKKGKKRTQKKKGKKPRKSAKKAKK